MFKICGSKGSSKFLFNLSFMKQKHYLGENGVPFIPKRLKHNDIHSTWQENLDEMLSDDDWDTDLNKPDVVQDSWDMSGDDDILRYVAQMENCNHMNHSDTDVKNSKISLINPIDILPVPSPEDKLISIYNTIDIPSSPIIQEPPQLKQYDHQLVFLTQIQSVHEQLSPSKIDREKECETNYMFVKNAKRVVPITLSEEQEHVIRLAKKGLHIFYTGSAGTGKSVLLRVLIKTLRNMYNNEGVAVTASTGLAACNIGGITIHSFAGIGLGKGDPEQLLKKVRRSRKHTQRWKTINALVIDEISMIDGELLDKLNHIAKRLRKSKKPFGGIQIILCGDFFQLPPVTKDNKAPIFAFDSNAWKESIDVTIMLKKVFRQQGDEKFIQMLNDMRMGNISKETELEFKRLSRPLPVDDIIPAELYSTRIEVEKANNLMLEELSGRIHTYNAVDGGDLDSEELKQKLLANFLAPKRLDLKIGAQVMNIKNIDETLVNGSLGKVIDFMDEGTYMFFAKCNDPDSSLNELTIFKEDILNGEIDLGSMDDDGKERKETRSSVVQKELKRRFRKVDETGSSVPLDETIFDFMKNGTCSDDPKQKKNIERKIQLIQELHMCSKGKKLPLVQFPQPNDQSRFVLIHEEAWAIEDEYEKPLVTRVQLPLILAWSISIHKSQGQTLSKVRVDLKKVFEKGQAYVALSRASSRHGLQVLNFTKTKVQAHERVIQFYETLSSADEVIKKYNKPQTKLNIKLTRSRSATITPPPPINNIRILLTKQKKKGDDTLNNQNL